MPHKKKVYTVGNDKFSKKTSETFSNIVSKKAYFNRYLELKEHAFDLFLD